MDDEIEDLWPDSIRVDTQTPGLILQAQAEILQKKTKGLIKGEVSADIGNNVKYLFDIVSSPKPQRYRLLAVTHEREAVYPVFLESNIFDREPDLLASMFHHATTRVASTASEFKSALKALFSSRNTLALIDSMIALTNEAMARAEVSGSNGNPETTGIETQKTSPPGS
jgi:hypothetical protein